MIDPQTVASFIRDTARSVILPRFRALKREEISEKGPGDFVTIADLDAERQLTALLTIDPIDGTANFARGEPGFAVILAYVENGDVRAGWIYDPLGDRMVWAVRDEGAWSGNARLEIAPTQNWISGAAYGRASSGERAAKALSRSGRIRAIRNQGCSGLEYLSIALGEAQFSLHSRSLPWDHAAGMLITAESSGKACFLDGGAYDPRVFDRAVLAAASAEAWQIVHDVVASPAEHRPT